MKARLSTDLFAFSPLGTARSRLDPAAALPAAAAAALADADLGAEEAFLVWQLVASAEGLGSHDRQLLACVLADSLVAVAAGSTRVAVRREIRPVLAGLGDLVGPPGSHRPLILDGAHLYHHRHFVSEERLANLVRARVAAPARWSGPAIEAALAAVGGTARPTPTDEQRQAVGAALGRRLAVISGPPGAGKTTIAVTLLRALVELGVPADAVALTAPTGKAANRLEEAVRAGLGNAGAATVPPAAATLHRLLGYSPSARAFARHEASPLSHQVVIVDECSMIDLGLMDQLLRALGSEAGLVLLGDADQLPSVEAGAVFRDLVPLGVRLTHSHRLDAGRPRGGRMLELAQSVRDGAAPAAAFDRRDRAADLAFEGPELVPAGEREALLERWFQRWIPSSPAMAEVREAVFPLGEGGFAAEVEARLDALAEHHRRFRLLAVTRGRPTGAEALNAWMHGRFGASGPAPIPGEPILMLRNDYDRALWNGDQGLCLRIRPEGSADSRSPRVAAAFKVAGRWVAWHLESLRDSLALAFALTVHKAQGSEHDEIALFLPDTPLPLTSRELLYTAITRSRRSVIVCGSPDLLAAAARNGGTRSSGLPERLGLA